MSLLILKLLILHYLGGGYTFLGQFFGTVNIGAGLTFFLVLWKGWSLERLIKKNLWDREMLMESWCSISFQHTAGYFQIWGKDTDGDGVYDKEDAVQKLLV
jgi:hypothetical protein